MNDLSQTKIKTLARENPDEEICGFIVATLTTERVVVVDNEAADKEGQFLMHPHAWAETEKAYGPILAVFHSHVHGRSALPSMPDRYACEQTGVPYWIYAVDKDEWFRHAPEGWVAPLVGREFCYGVLDCYTLIRDWYRYTREQDPLAPGLGIHLIDLVRPDYRDLKSGDVYSDLYHSAGFVQVPKATMRQHDLAVMSWREMGAHHGAIYIGDGMLLHHLEGTLSCRIPYRDVWRERTIYVLRHTEMLKKGDLVDEPDYGTAPWDPGQAVRG